MINEAKLIGRLGADPVIKVAGNKNVSTLNVATWENYWDGKEWQTITEWHRVVVWDKAAEHLDKIRKGDMVYVSGKIKTRKYKDPGTDVDKYITEIHGIIKPLPKAQSTESRHPEQNNTSVEPPIPGADEGTDLPF